MNEPGRHSPAPRLVNTKRALGAGSLAAPAATATRAAAIGLVVVGLAAAGAATGLALGNDAAGEFSFFAATAMFAVAGGVVAHRRPGNPVGWLLAGWGVASLLSQVALHYALVPGRPAVDAVGWFGSWSWALGPALLGLALLRFPDGHLPGRHWRWIHRGGIAGIGVIAATGVLLWPYRGPALSGIGDPSGFEGPAAVVWDLGGWLVFIPAIASAVSLAVRYRRSGRVERAQIKWIVLPALLAGAGILGFALTGAPGVDAHPLAELLAISGFFGMPIAIAIAVLRYRLFEIDRLLSRTVSYALVTGVLVAVYAGGVVAFGQALSPLTQESELAVAASTLLVAALFQPVRRRVQTLVDRRFNRARYDAQRTIEAFTARLRDEVDLDELSEELAAVVHRTVMPATASIWFREAAR